jgi:glycosyltransferase involved in cell wall biosynthesis
MPMTKDLSVIIPAYNEAKTIGVVINALVEHLTKLDYELLVINDASSDNTADLVSEISAQNDNVHLINHLINQGKTPALITGFKASQGRVVIVQDADLEYDPADIERVIAPILNHLADVVYGSRMLDPKNRNKFLFESYMANKVITFVSNIFTRYKFSDVETCYKAFRREIIQNMVINSRRFGFEVEVTAKISKLDLRTCEVPISFSSRSYDEGKKINAMDGVQALYYILKYNLFSSKEKSFVKEPDLKEDTSPA